MAQSPQLRSVEADPPSTPQPAHGNGGGNGRFGERIARIEAKMEYVATKEDISDLRTLIAKTDSSRAKWSIGIMVTVVLALITASVFVTVAVLRIPTVTS